MEAKQKVGYGIMVLALVLIIIMIFVKASYDENRALTCELVSENPDIEMEDCPYHQSDTTGWIISIAFGIAAVLLAIGFYLTLKLEKPERVEVDVSNLDNEEKQVYELLKEGDGSVYQSDIVKGTDMSKVKVSRVLDKMETKGILERKRRGMTNLVVLK